MRVLVTGAAGFIGFHASRRLLGAGHSVVGVDSVNAYYDPALKAARLEQLQRERAFEFHRIDIADREAVRALPLVECDAVLHLAAQAGVRYSLQHPQAYVDSNLVGFGNIIEACRHAKTRHLVYASSSSVYGANTQMPFSVRHPVDHPLTLYAATKRANELMAHSYSHLFGLPTTGLRFFTVYGPWGRPDMALFIFTKAILAGTPIELFNHGKMRRDFTFVDDIVEGVIRLLDHPPRPAAAAHDAPNHSRAPFQLFNIGNNRPVELGRVIELLEEGIGRPAIRKLVDLQPGDVVATYADVSDLESAIDFRPRVSIEEGIQRFLDWYLDFYDHRRAGVAAARGHGA